MYNRCTRTCVQLLLFIAIFALVITVFTALCPAVLAAPVENEIGGFSPGQSAIELKKLGMPFPPDTYSFHTFSNKSGNTFMRFGLVKQGTSWHISSVTLVDSASYPKRALLEEHQMLTGVALKPMKTGKGLTLGASAKTLKQLYGSPTRKIKTPTGENWIYESGTTARQNLFVVGISKNRVVLLELKH